jgi:hypothetical protein
VLAAGRTPAKRARGDTGEVRKYFFFEKKKQKTFDFIASGGAI